MKLFEASTDTLQPGGEHLVDPDHIEVGWKISIPGEGTAHANGDRGGNHGNHGNQGDREDQGDGAGEQTPETPDVTPEDQGEQGDQGQQGEQGDQGQQDDEVDATEEQNPSGETPGDQSVDEVGDEACSTPLGCCPD